MQKRKATAGTVANIWNHTDSVNYSNYNICISSNSVEFNCHDIAFGSELEGGQKKRGNFMFRCPNCGKSLLGVNLEKNKEHGGVWHCLKCDVGGNRFELAAFIFGCEYNEANKKAVHFFIRNIMEKKFGIVIQFKSEPRKKYSIEKPKLISRVNEKLINENALFILPSLATAYGTAKAAILQDIHYLSCGRFKKERMARSVSDWQVRLSSLLSPNRVREALAQLETDKLILKNKEKTGTYWSINYAELEQSLSRKASLPVDIHTAILCSVEKSNQNG